MNHHLFNWEIMRRIFIEQASFRPPEHSILKTDPRAPELPRRTWKSIYEAPRECHKTYQLLDITKFIFKYFKEFPLSRERGDDLATWGSSNWFLAYESCREYIRSCPAPSRHRKHATTKKANTEDVNNRKNSGLIFEIWAYSKAIQSGWFVILHRRSILWSNQ